MNKTNTAAGGTSTLATMEAHDIGGWSSEMIAKAVAAANAAEQVILVVSNAATEGGESHDVAPIALEKTQVAMATAVLKAVAERNLKNEIKNEGAPVAVAMVLINGAVIAIDGLRDQVPAILEVFMPGEWAPSVCQLIQIHTTTDCCLPLSALGFQPPGAYGSKAMAATIFGDNNPGGKMPGVTMYYR
jgi:hypothetical protein